MSAKVMVVDDDEAVAAVIVLKLREVGVEPTVARGGREAIQRLCQATAEGWSYDLMLLDISMPDVNGWEVLRAVKSNPVWAPLKVVVLTAYANTADDMARVAQYDGVHVEKKGQYLTMVGELAERMLAQ
jgi:CheY-like chemotaxis protein